MNETNYFNNFVNLFLSQITCSQVAQHIYVACTYLLKIKNLLHVFLHLILVLITSIEHLKIGFFFLMCNRNPIREPSEYMFSLKILHNFILYKKKNSPIFNNSEQINSRFKDASLLDNTPNLGILFKELSSSNYLQIAFIFWLQTL